MAQSAIQLTRRRVYDAVHRLLHAAIGVATLLAFVSGWALDSLEWGPARHTGVTIHLAAGNALLVSLVGRLVWGFVGPPAARLSDLWWPRAWRALLRKPWRAPCPTTFGHDPQAALAYLCFYGATAVACGSGLVLAASKHLAGPLSLWLSDEIRLQALATQSHLVGYVAVAFFVVAHIGALVLHERHWGIPLTQAMLSGFQYRPVVAESGDDAKGSEESP